MSNLIKVKIPKALLLLTESEYKAGIKRGKAYLRKQSLEKRLKNSKPNERGQGVRNTYDDRSKPTHAGALKKNSFFE